MKPKIEKIISIAFLFLSTVTFALSVYIKNEFGDAKFEQLLYSLRFSEGTSDDILIHGVRYCLPFALLLTFILSIPLFIKIKRTSSMKIQYKKKEKCFKIPFFPLLNSISYSIIIFIFLVLYSLNSIGTFTYLKNQKENSKIFENYYINPNKVQIEFPEEKTNLIFIYLESMEMGFRDVTIDDQKVNMIPNLEKLAKENLNFSNTDYLGGTYSAYGTGWTIAGIVSQTTGVPFKVSIDGNEYNHYKRFLPGITSLGDVLESEGYNQVFMMGSPKEFAGRDQYLTEHGNYQILDLAWAHENKKISSDYYEFWGFEDKKLFEFAKAELNQLARKEEPFNFTLLTVDTHAVDGYLDSSCNAKYTYPYANAISCSDSMVVDFVRWIQKQDFYENTVIILSGDHPTMQGNIVDYLNNSSRNTYNVFINSKVEANNSKNRVFNNYDIFPTTLASLGVQIEGNRLGLGTNLFSEKQSLAEELGVDYLEEELAKKSNYYNKNFMQGTYYEIMKEQEEIEEKK